MVGTVREPTETVSSGKKPISETRWSARADAVKALASNYKVIQNSVDAIARTSTQPPLILLEAVFGEQTELSEHRSYVHCVEQHPGHIELS